MYVVRPPGIKGTPFAVAQELGCQTRFYPNEKHPRVFDHSKDFFMTSVHLEDLADTFPPTYLHTECFATRHKFAQRKLLQEAGVPVPWCASSHENATHPGNHFVVRPLHHSRSQNYRVTNNPLDFIPGVEYISALFLKRREYRVIYVFGKPLIYLRKKPNEGVTYEQPWGHENSVFKTIHDVPGSYIGASDIVGKIGNTQVVQGAHIVAADILFNPECSPPFVCLELNFCPSLTIDDNRAKVVAVIKERNNVSVS